MRNKMFESDMSDDGETQRLEDDGIGGAEQESDSGPDTSAETQTLELTPDSVKGQADLKEGEAISLIVQGKVGAMQDDGSLSVEIDRIDHAPGNPPKLGSGERFHALENQLSHKKGVTDPKALAAAIGRKKYGAKKMASMASAGRRG